MFTGNTYMKKVDTISDNVAICTVIVMMLLPFSAERPPGYDRVRNAEIGNKDFELDVLEEAYTTEHWLVRIYKVR